MRFLFLSLMLSISLSGFADDLYWTDSQPPERVPFRPLAEVVTGTWSRHAYEGYRFLSSLKDQGEIDPIIVVYHWGDILEHPQNREHIRQLGDFSLIPTGIINRSPRGFFPPSYWSQEMPLSQDVPLKGFLDLIGSKGPQWTIEGWFDKPLDGTRLEVLLVEHPLKGIPLENPYPYLSPLDYHPLEENTFLQDLPWVFREFITPSGGITLTFPEQWEKNLLMVYNFNLPLDPQWKRENLYITALLYNQQGLIFALQEPLFQ